MSYILDALRRAEADRERERGQVPGLHTRALSGSDTTRPAGQRRWLPWAGFGLLLLAGIGVGGWWVSGPHGTASPVAPPLAQPSPQPVPAPLASTAPVAGPAPADKPSSAGTPTPQPAASASPYLPPMPPPAALSTAPASRTIGVTPAAPAVVTAATPAPVSAAPPAPPPTPAAEAILPRLAELPEAIRRDVPRFVVSGSVYSDDPRGRFAMINGEVLREGAQIAPDLVLEQIRPRELVLRFKGQRYRQPV